MGILECPNLTLTALLFGMFSWIYQSALRQMLTISRHHTRVPKPFECIVKPRSDAAIKLVKEINDRANY
jgi:hypothetical protein